MATFFIAEVGSVHDGSLGNASRLIDAAASIGADAVKFQTHIAAAETLRDAPSPPYFSGESRYEYFERTGFSRAEWGRLKAHCDARGIAFMSSPFSAAAVQLLEEVGMARYKMPSGEITNLPLIEEVARTGKQVLLSSGMSTWAELDRAVETVLKHHDDVVLLQCTSEYPCSCERVGLNVMVEMKERYGLRVGLSDHTLTPFASLAAVALGAAVIEKHLTFSRLMYGSDAPHSLEPAEMEFLIRGIRETECVLNSAVDKDGVAAELAHMKTIFQKSIVSAVPIPKGTRVTRDMLDFKKPGTGIPAADLPDVVGKVVVRDVPENHLIARDDLAAG